MSEVPRIWRLMKRTVDPKLSQCGNCGDVALEIGRPICRRCNLEFEYESVRIYDQVKTEAHRVVGKKMRVYFNEVFPPVEMPIQVELRRRVSVDVGV